MTKWCGHWNSHLIIKDGVTTDMCVECAKSDAKAFAEVAKETADYGVYQKNIKYLTDVNADLVNYYGLSPVMLPPWKGDVEMVKSYEEKKARRLALRALANKLTLRTPRSQKAAGIQVLCNVALANVPKFYLLQNLDEAVDAFELLREDYPQGKLFARPCPTRPRHGFVDSRPVSTADEVVEIMRQTLEADDLGELILMPAINAKYNAIWRPGLLAFGPGNDGATSGHGSRSIPLVSVSLSDMSSYRDAFENARISDGDVGYIESVISLEDEDQWGRARNTWTRYLTQLRGGPAMSTSKPDYIPALTSVSNVVIAEGDLLEWETKAAGFTPGTVVYHPGGSLASHYAVHCVLNNVPILVSSEPKVGDILEPNSNKEPLDVQAAVRGVAAASAIDLKTEGNAPIAVKAMLTGLHNVAAFEGQDAFYIGAASAIMIRMGIAASCGEARHAQKSSEAMFSMDRDIVYTDSFADLFESRKLLATAYDMFVNRHWNSGYGGRPWAMCTKAVSDLDDAVRDMVRNPSTEALNTVISKLNIAINMAHNNGWWMNKFVDGNVMDRAAKGYPDVFIDSVPTLAALHDVPEDVIDTMYSAWQSAPRNGVVAIIEARIKLTSARFIIKTFANGSKYLHVQYKTKGVKAHSSFNLPAKYASAAEKHLLDADKVPSMAADGLKTAVKGYYKLKVSNKANGIATLKFTDGTPLVSFTTRNNEAMQAKFDELATQVQKESTQAPPSAAKELTVVTPKYLPATVTFGTPMPEGVEAKTINLYTMELIYKDETVTYKWGHPKWIAVGVKYTSEAQALPKEVPAFDWPKGTQTIKLLDSKAEKWLMEINGLQGAYQFDKSYKVWKLQEEN